MQSGLLNLSGFPRLQCSLEYWNCADSQWPEIPYAAWRETRDPLQLWTQIVGKIRLMQSPWPYADALAGVTVPMEEKHPLENQVSDFQSISFDRFYCIQGLGRF